MAAKAVGSTPWQRGIRAALVVGYAGAIAVGLTTDSLPRYFWTMLLPLLPVSIVLMGFPNWRRVCPLAFFGEVGRSLNRGTQRRVPKWFERWFYLVTFAFLLSMLVLRLVATNGDGRWLAGLLVGLALAAALTNWIFTGKTWCNFLCPVGLVERIYTEPNSLPPEVSNSQCVRCTACKKHCPDIDQENAYWQDVTSPTRRLAMFAFPGLVLSFYTYYWLRHGDWEAYFDGRWTRLPVTADLVAGAGFFFAPQVPAIGAALATLLAFSAASYGVFLGIEAILGRSVVDAERRRHLALTIAAFVAFSIFYFFAGAPSLRKLPGGTRTVAFAAPLIATLFAIKRGRRTRERYIQEKGAVKLLRNWPFEDPPPQDAGEVYAWIKAGEHAREQYLTAYTNTVREIIADGLVGRGELRFLDEIRNQLGITPREHEKVIERLSEEERRLFEQRGVGVEERAQLEGYKTALAAALLRRASASELTELQRAFGVSPEAHAGVLEQMRGESGALLARARGQMEHALAVRRDLTTLGAPDQPGAAGLLSYLLTRELEAAISRVLEFLEIAGDAERVQALRPGLLAPEVDIRGSALRQLAEACPGSEALVAELEPLILDRSRMPTDADLQARAGTLDRLAQAPDPYIRAAAVWAAGTDRGAPRSIVSRSLEDSHPLVRETAALCVRRAEDGPESSDDRFSSLATIEKMQFLREVPLFAHLDPEDLEDLSRLTEDEIVTLPEVLCEEGEMDADAVFIIVDGLASVLLRARTASGEEIDREVAVLGAGEVVGELSLLDGSPRMATVRPKDGPLRVLRIPGHMFRSRLLHRPRVAQPLLATLARRLRLLSQRVADHQEPP